MFNLIIITICSIGIMPYSQLHALKKCLTFKTMPEAYNIARKFIQSSQPTIVDVGAGTGAGSLQLNQAFPQATIHAIEPITPLYASLCLNTKHQNNIKNHQIALSNVNGTACMYESQDRYAPGVISGSSSLLAPKEHKNRVPWIDFNESKEVITTLTLDRWAERNNVNAIDLLVLDTQGTELLILQSSPHILKTVQAIIVEVEFIEAYQGQALFDDVQRYLEQQGFTLLAHDFGTLCDWYGNALFVRLSPKK